MKFLTEIYPHRTQVFQDLVEVREIFESYAPDNSDPYSPDQSELSSNDSHCDSPISPTELQNVLYESDTAPNSPIHYRPESDSPSDSPPPLMYFPVLDPGDLSSRDSHPDSPISLTDLENVLYKSDLTPNSPIPDDYRPESLSPSDSPPPLMYFPVLDPIHDPFFGNSVPYDLPPLWACQPPIPQHNKFQPLPPFTWFSYQPLTEPSWLRN